METFMNFMSAGHGAVFVLATILILIVIVVKWKAITEWIGMIQPPEWMNTLAMVIALGVFPLFYVYGRWITVGIIILVVIFTL